MSLTYKSPFQKWTEVVLIWLEKEVEKKRKGSGGMEFWRHSGGPWGVPMEPQGTIWKLLSVHAKSLQSCPTLGDPVDCCLPSSWVRGDSPGKNTSSRGSSWPRDWTCISCCSCIAGRFFATELSSLTRDQTCTSCLGSTRVLSTGPLRKSNKKFLDVPFHFKA